MAGHIAQLAARGVVGASGPDALKLLDSLITNDMGLLASQAAMHAGLLSPQGKILFAFFVVGSGDDFLLDVARDQAAALVKRLNMYKLRAAATFTDLSAQMTIAVAWGGPAPAVPRGILAYPDPRHAELGTRLLLPTGRLPELGTINADDTGYQIHRVGLGVPDEISDYPLGDTFPHEADFDLFNGVSFKKGCYVGQEVVSRMQNKTVVRKRVVRIEGDGLAPGAEVKHGDGIIGTVGSLAGRNALAMLRLDRAVEAADKCEMLTANGQTITVDAVALARYRDSLANKPVIDL